MQHIFTIVAGILLFVGYVPYVLGMVRGSSHPTKASWIIWASLDGITVAGMLAKHALNGQITGALAGSGIVALFAFRYGVPGWSRLDLFCLLGGMVGLFLWWLTTDATFAIVLSMTVTFLGSIPTFVSAYKNPHYENRTAWTFFFVSCLFALPAIPAWTLADALQPINFTITETIMMYLLYVQPSLFGRRMLRSPMSRR